jgi:hypothetical protein
MSFFIMFFLFHLCYNLTTDLTLVVISGATYLMHSEFTHFDISLTGTASLGRLCFTALYDF